MAQAGVEEKVQDIVNNLLRADALEEAFTGFVVQSERNNHLKIESSLDYMKKNWALIPQEQSDAAIKYYVNCIHAQTNSRRVTLLLDMLDALVAFGTIQAKSACMALLNCDRLTYTAAEKWCQSFVLVKKMLKSVDYKGCRDFLKIMLEKALEIPASDNVHTLQVLDILYDVVKYTLDRDECLLPGYFAINEINRMITEDSCGPHWRLRQLLADFVQSFRPAAQLVSVADRSKLLPIVGHSSAASNVWKLASTTLKFPLNGPLPYDKALSDPQGPLLRYVLEQPYSRDMVCSMLQLNKQMKQRYFVLEEELVNLVVVAMERTEEAGDAGDEFSSLQLLWHHLSSQLIYFVLFQFASFPRMVQAIFERLKEERPLRKGRDHLMWVLLQFISGSINKSPLEDFLPVMKLYDLLYPEQTPLPMPDVSVPSCTHKMAVTCIWIHLNRKASSNQVQLQRPIPHALSKHIEFLKQCYGIVKNLPMSDYKVALLCNAFSTNQEIFSQPISNLVEGILGSPHQTTLLPGNIKAGWSTQPPSLSFLDSLTVHTKMSLIHSIVGKVMVLTQRPKNSLALSPALVETYSRLLVYMEIESLGMKGFISQVLPTALHHQAWGLMHTLLEMFSYRIHHIQPHYRIQLLSQLYSLANVPLNQLYLCIESTALRLIMGLGSWEVQPQLARAFSEPKAMVSTDSEEINRILILTLARAIHVTGSESISATWCRDILNTIMQHTPHRWASHTLDCFPPAISEFFLENKVDQEDSATLKNKVESEYRKWNSMAAENDLIGHFSMQGSAPLFFCVLFKSLRDDNRISPMAYKVLERLGPRALAAHMRTFADYLVHEFSMSYGQRVQKCVDCLNDMVWKYNVVPIDRLVLSMVLRPLEANEAQVRCLIIQLLLLKPPDFRTRVNDFIRENVPEHWLQSDWHEKHMAFHRKFPEKFYFEGLQEASQQSSHQYLPIYFGNVCLRFLPVFDILIHRFLELKTGPGTQSLEKLLEHLGALYKFHDRPVLFLYNTLHYYEKKLGVPESISLKKQLVNAVIGSQKEIKPANWCLTEDYQKYLTQEEPTWEPKRDYYINLITRLMDTIAGKSPSPFPSCDWRFNEFPNLPAHALYCTCVELMALPVQSQVVGDALLDIVLKAASQLKRDRIMEYMNAIGLILTALPSSYWGQLNERIMETMKNPQLAEPVAAHASKIFQMLNFATCHQVAGESHCSYVLALCHAVWQHASIGQLSSIPQFMREKLKSVVKTEEQYIFMCHLLGPFLQRFYTERPKRLMELTVELYEMLDVVDKSVETFHHMDVISDFLYHIKYMYVGHGVKKEVEKLICNLRLPLQMRLRFISHQGKEDPTPT